MPNDDSQGGVPRNKPESELSSQVEDGHENGAQTEEFSNALARFFKTEKLDDRDEPAVPGFAVASTALRYADAIQYLLSICEGKGHEVAVHDAGYSDSVGRVVSDALARQVQRNPGLGFCDEFGEFDASRVGGHVRNRLAELNVAASKLSASAEFSVVAFGSEVNGLFTRNIYPDKPRPYIELKSEAEFLLTLPAVCACVQKLGNIQVEVVHPRKKERFAKIMSKKSLPSLLLALKGNDIDRWLIGFRSKKTKKSARTLLQLVVLSAALRAAEAQACQKAP